MSSVDVDYAAGVVTELSMDVLMLFLLKELVFIGIHCK